MEDIPLYNEDRLISNEIASKYLKAFGFKVGATKLGLRQVEGYTIYELNELLGNQKSWIHRFQGGNSADPHFYTARQIARRLDVSPVVVMRIFLHSDIDLRRENGTFFVHNDDLGEVLSLSKNILFHP